MNEIVFILNSVIVFLVPCLFGWTVLRRLVREYDPLLLAAGASVLGLTTLMVLMNELRYWLEMAPAAWFAYKAMLAATLSILVLSRTPRRSLIWPAAGRGWIKLGVVVAGTAVTAVYFGLPAFRGFLNDAWWFHYPMAVQIQTTAYFPLHHPLAVDDPLYYHFGPDILAATWAYLLDQPVTTGFAINIVWFAPAAFLLAYALVLRLSRQYFAALAAAVCLVVGGNLRFFNLIGADLGSPASRLQVFNSQTIQGLLQMVFTPSHAMGIPLSLLVLAIFRHYLARPGWLLRALLGLSLGSVTLVAEWYFFPLCGALGFTLLLHGRRRTDRQHWSLNWVPLAIAVGCGLFNNTYVAGLFGRYWMHYTPMQQTVHARQVEARSAQLTTHRHELTPTLRLLEVQPGLSPALSELPAGQPEVPRPGPTAARAFIPELIPENDSEPLPTRAVTPDLIPLRLNLHHLGETPSWEKAGSNDSSWVSLASWAFVSELLPVIGLGLPFGWWLWRRTKNLLVLTVFLLAGLSMLPPIVLDWGYRSTDFLRFFTGAFSFAALLFGLFVGRLLQQTPTGPRALGFSLAGIGILNAAGLGLLGLMPGTLETAKRVSDQGISLSKAALSMPTATATAPADPPTATPRIPQPEALRRLASRLDSFLFSLTKGRERALVIVPTEQLPPQVVFQEWMKLGTMSRVLLPIGWYWNDSLYAVYCRQALTTLDASALASLDVKWIIVTNLWDYPPPSDLVTVLQDRGRFMPAASFNEGSYYLAVYRSQ